MFFFVLKICNLVNIFSKNEKKDMQQKDFCRNFFTIFKKKYIKLATFRPKESIS
jgi:hypothetical protein